MLLRELEGRQRRRRDDRLHLRHIGAHEDLSIRSRRLADAEDACMRERRAQERNLALAWQDHVGNELAAPVQVARVLLARNSRPDPLAGFTVLAHCRTKSGTDHVFPGQVDKNVVRP
jgi:hypothetical protein